MTQFKLPAEADYAELREHEVRKSRKVMIDGNLTANTETSESGVSARVFRQGYWGFASVPATDAASRDRVAGKAFDNACTMARFGNKPALTLAGDHYQGEQASGDAPGMSQSESVELLEAVNAHCKQHFPRLKSTY